MALLQAIRSFFFGGAADAPRAEGSCPVPSRLIVGLGNPGSKYVDTRHNIGFRIVMRIAERAGERFRHDDGLEALVASVSLSGEACLLVAPQTFMNDSGRSVAKALDRWPSLDPATDLLIAYDEMDLPTGRIRLRAAGGAGGHRGIGDILDVLETKAVPRLRFGIGHPGAGGAVIDWVLAPFSAEEEALLSRAVDRAVNAIEVALSEGIPAAMGQFNRSN